MAIFSDDLNQKPDMKKIFLVVALIVSIASVIGFGLQACQRKSALPASTVAVGVPK